MRAQCAHAVLFDLVEDTLDHVENGPDEHLLLVLAGSRISQGHFHLRETLVADEVVNC